MVRFLGVTAFAAAICSASPAAAGPDATRGEALDFTALVVEPVIAPRPVEATDERRHLVYELLLVNETDLHVQIDEIRAIDAATGASLGEWRGDALAAILRMNGKLPGVTLRPGGSAYAFLDATAPKRGPLPKAIKHRIAVSRFMGKDKDTLVPLDPKSGVPALANFETAKIAVDSGKPVVVDPPLRGRGWVAFNGCCANLQHRGAVMAFNGAPKIPERFAIDFMRLDGDRRLFSGAVDRNESYAAYGAPVYSVANGTVIETSDGAPERIPTKPRDPTRFDNAGGNDVVIDIGGGRYAFFAHLKTGTVAVKRGERVKAGDVIGYLGNTGNSDAPHLHFHIMDGPSPFASNGIPYEFSTFASEGRLSADNDRSFETGAPVKLDPGLRSGPHKAQLPLDLEIVDFPE
ncbi:M23 family metallopeptidase [Methylocystis parvus]|uniref:M23 family metallopeptidase n=1 Tax=Methylocystis parvus TaxID=134 RepID=UPI003C706293